MNIINLLNQLDAQFAQLTRKLNPIARQRCLYPRFRSGLFRQPAYLMQDYLQEVSDNLQRLRQLVSDKGAIEAIDWLATRVAEQSEALCLEAASWPLRAADLAHKPTARLYMRLLHLQNEQQHLLKLQNDAVTSQHDVHCLPDTTQQEQTALQYLLDRNEAASKPLYRMLARREHQFYR